MKNAREKTKRLFKWGDLIILFVLLVAASLSLWLALRPSNNGQIVEIYENGVLSYSIPLYENQEIVLDKHGHNVVKIENGKVFMLESDCPGKDCLHAKSLTAEGGIIVCLPNKVVVKIAMQEVDAIT